MDKQPQEMEIKDQHSITKMRTAGRLARRILDLAGTLARPGTHLPSLLLSVAHLSFL
jgi:methionine aminopeptidase